MLHYNVERIEHIVVPYKIPFYSQHIDSSHYEQYGFSHPEVAEYWSDHGDGIACLRMVVDGLCARNDMPKTQSECIHLVIKNRAYSDLGWNHRALVDMAREAGVHGVVKRYQPINSFIEELEQGRSCIASVTPLFKGGQVDEKGNVRKAGGHLVVVFGLELDDQIISHVLVHHPSSIPKYNLESKWIWAQEFKNSFTGHYMAFWQ